MDDNPPPLLFPGFEVTIPGVTIVEGIISVGEAQLPRLILFDGLHKVFGDTNGDISISNLARLAFGVNEL